MDSQKILLLLFTAFLVKHFLADFPLQTPFMLGKGKDGIEWILPLAAHAGVHAMFTAIIFALYKPVYMWLAVVDFILHFIIDRIKASYRLDAGLWISEQKGRSLTKYYLAFGLDQLGHYLTYVLVLYISL